MKCGGVLWDEGLGGGMGLSWVTGLLRCRVTSDFPREEPVYGGRSCGLGAALAARICGSSSHPLCSLQPEQWGALPSCFCTWLSC